MNSRKRFFPMRPAGPPHRLVLRVGSNCLPTQRCALRRRVCNLLVPHILMPHRPPASTSATHGAPVGPSRDSSRPLCPDKRRRSTSPVRSGLRSIFGRPSMSAPCRAKSSAPAAPALPPRLPTLPPPPIATRRPSARHVHRARPAAQPVAAPLQRPAEPLPECVEEGSRSKDTSEVHLHHAAPHKLDIPPWAGEDSDPAATKIVVTDPDGAPRPRAATALTRVLFGVRRLQQAICTNAAAYPRGQCMFQCGVAAHCLAAASSFSRSSCC
jgi:hypothetical protein